MPIIIKKKEKKIVQNFSQYLKETILCDFNNKLIRDTAIILRANERGLRNREPSQKEMAIRIYSFVRDEIKFGLDLFYRKASETLIRKVGFYSQKANLQVALLRSAKIPARFHIVKIPMTIFNEIFAKWQIKYLSEERIPKKLGLPYCEVYLNNRWIACQCLFDVELSPHLASSWDGERNLIFFQDRIEEDLGVRNSIDELVEKESVFTKIICAIDYFFINRYLNAIRKRNREQVLRMR